MMRKLVIGLICSILLAAALALLTGALGVVKTHGNSMAPRITEGDLVIVRSSTTYEVGDVVAYRSAELDQVVLHRIIAITDGRYAFRGDHNEFDDVEQLTHQQLMGQELVRIPAGATWLDRLVHPIVLGVLTFGLLASGTAAGIHRRHRRTRENKTMSQHSAAHTRHWAADVSRPVRNTVAIGAVAGAVGLIVAAAAWTQPTTELESGAVTGGRTMSFSYHADVLSSPAYDSTRVTAPAPIFRRITDELGLRYTYQGDPGTVIVTAELSAANGWHSQIALTEPVSFDDPDFTGTVRLDIEELEARAQAAAKAIGTPIEQVEVAVVPTVTTQSGEVFAPRLTFALTLDQLTLVGGTPSLTVIDTAAPTDDETRTAGTLGTDKYRVSVSSLRTASTGLLLAGLLAIGVAIRTARRSSTNEAAAIKRRYAPVLLHVEPVTSPPGRPVVDVTDFQALARLAARYDLLVMHWTRSDVETFIVHDDGITYRYRIGSHQPDTTTSSSHPLSASSAAVREG